jgi:hypothetical protein
MVHPRALPAALIAVAVSAACAHAQAAAPFPVLDTAPPPARSNALANSAIVTGVVLIGSSFVFEHQADQAYDAYLAASEPNDITTLYDRTVKYDRLSAATLIGGNVLVATGLFLRFVHRPPPERLRLALGPNRCALSCVF